MRQNLQRSIQPVVFDKTLMFVGEQTLTCGVTAGRYVRDRYLADAPVRFVEKMDGRCRPDLDVGTDHLSRRSRVLTSVAVPSSLR